MGFRDDVSRFSLTVQSRSRDVFVGVTTEVQRAVTVGSPVTGSPGVPVQTGALRASYIGEFVDANTWQTTTNLAYARPIEMGLGPHGPLTVRSSTGGFHSIGLLVAGWGRLVRFVVAQTRSGNSGGSE